MVLRTVHSVPYDQVVGAGAAKQSPARKNEDNFPANPHDLSVTTEDESVAMVSGATDVRFGSSVPHG